jgi:hypothetical protein
MLGKEQSALVGIDRMVEDVEARIADWFMG